MTPGWRVHAFDLQIVGEFLPRGTLDCPMIPCVAEPGDAGMIQLVPAELAVSVAPIGHRSSEVPSASDLWAWAGRAFTAPRSSR